MPARRARSATAAASGSAPSSAGAGGGVAEEPGGGRTCRPGRRRRAAPRRRASGRRPPGRRRIRHRPRRPTTAPDGCGSSSRLRSARASSSVRWNGTDRQPTACSIRSRKASARCKRRVGRLAGRRRGPAARRSSRAQSYSSASRRIASAVSRSSSMISSVAAVISSARARARARPLPVALPERQLGFPRGAHARRVVVGAEGGAELGEQRLGGGEPSPADQQVEPGEVDGEGEVRVDVAGEHAGADGVGLGPPPERQQGQRAADRW